MVQTRTPRTGDTKVESEDSKDGIDRAVEKTSERELVVSTKPQTPEVRRSARQAQREKEGKGWSLKKLIVDFGTHKATYDVEINEPESGKKSKKSVSQKKSKKTEDGNKDAEKGDGDAGNKKGATQVIKESEKQPETNNDEEEKEFDQGETEHDESVEVEETEKPEKSNQEAEISTLSTEQDEQMETEQDETVDFAEGDSDIENIELEGLHDSESQEETGEDSDEKQLQEMEGESSTLDLEVDEELDDDYGDDDDDYIDNEYGGAAVKQEGEEIFALDGSQRIIIKQEITEDSEEELLFVNFLQMEGAPAKKGQNIKVPLDEVQLYVDKAKIDGEEAGKNTKVICPLCLKSVLRTYVRHHLRKTHVKGRYPCQICNKVFQHRGYLTEHERFVHKGIKKNRKSSLDSGTLTPGKAMSQESRELLASAKIYGEEDGLNTKVYCPKCDKILLRTYLVKHNQKIHSDNKFPCPQCDKVFQYNGYLSDHIRYVHKGIRKRSWLNKHARDTDPELGEGGDYKEKIRVQCPKCERVVMEEYLAKHMKFAHSDKNFPCDQCEKTFTCARFLYDHRKYVHIDKRTECEICGKMFKGFPAKEKHKKSIHSDIKRYQCAVCGDKFRTTIECNRHMYTHEDPNIYCYQCPKCERRFRNPKMMNLHVRQVHKRLGRLQCKWPGCDKILNDKATFKKHYCIHTGEKPNQCPLCDRRFIQRVALKYHLKTQHKEVDYSKLMPPAKQAEHKDRRPESDITEMLVEPVQAPVDEEEEEETTTIQVEVPEGTDIQSLIAGSNMVEGTPVELTDSAIVSDLINIAQSSEGGTVPEALQHVFEGGNKTIVIYYQ